MTFANFASRSCALGGGITVALALCTVIFILGMLPMWVSDTVRLEIRVPVKPISIEALSLSGKHLIDGFYYDCTIADKPANLPWRELTCITIERNEGDPELLTRLESLIADRGWIQEDTAPSFMQSVIAESWLVLLIGALYIAIAAALLKYTLAGWGGRELLRTRWWVLLLIPLPLVVAMLASALLSASASLLFGISLFPSQPGEMVLELKLPELHLLDPLLLLPLMAAFPEEAVFRGWLHERFFKHLPPWAAYLLVAAVFVLAHLALLINAVGGGSHSGVAAVQVVLLFVGSLVLTWLRCRTGSVLLCAAAHALQNLVLIVLLLSAR